MKKARQFDLTPTKASDFCQPRSSSIHNCCTTGMTRTTTSVSTEQLLIFLISLLAVSVARENILVSASSCKQGANEGISQAGHTKFSLVYCPTLPVQHLISICGNYFLVGISYVQETQQLER